VLSRSEVLDRLSLRPGDEWSASAESVAAVGLLGAYAELGRLDAEVTLRSFEGPAGVRLLVEVREGPAVPVGRLDIAGTELFRPEEVLDRFDTRVGKTLDSRRLEADVDRLLAAYGRKGFPFARLLVTSVGREEDRLDLSLRIVEGPLLSLGDLRVTGNEHTKPATVRHLSKLAFGKPYDQDAVDASRIKLIRSGLFRAVSEPAVRVNWKEKEAVVEMDVEEARSNRIAGAIGYAPGPSGGEGIVSGYADVSFRNILGTARSGGARWERPSAETRRVRLFYREPWVLGGPFALGGELEQDIRDSTFTRVSGAISAGIDLSRRVSASFEVGLEGMRPRRDASPVPRSARRHGGVGIVFEGRDVPLNATGGVFLRIASEYAERRIEEERERGIEGETARQATLEAGYGLYQGAGARTVLAWEVAGIGRFSSEAFVPSYDQFYLGGARTLRGYEEDRFRGARVAWSRLEYRYLLGVLSRVFLFLDAGYVFAESEEEERVVSSEKVKRGYGFGIRFDSALGLLGVDYGLGEGDSFGEGKLHVSAEGEF
jgi:outer membrane protein assembly factor BamA